MTESSCAFHFVADQWVNAPEPSQEIAVQSPADDRDQVARFGTSPVLVDHAVTEARSAAGRWRRLTQDARNNFLRGYQRALKARREDLTLAIAREIGKPLWEARTEVAAMIGKVDLTLGEGMRFTTTDRLENLPGEIRHRPHGVMAVVGPFNFPGHLPNGQFVPALALGNVVIFKPSEKAPLTARIIAECMHAAQFPRGVFQVVQGGHDVAQALVSHPGIDGIFFTGSLAVGTAIARANAHRPGCMVALELGGKNAALVLDDANVERAAREIAFAAFATAGQRCTATSRVYVHKSRADELVSRLKTATQSVRVGHFADANAFCGPMISDASVRALETASLAAEACGFERIAGGERASVDGYIGHYVQPSIHVAPASDAVAAGYTDHELFGPNACVYVVDNDEQAIERANSSQFGLVAAVFTRDASRFEHVASELRVGVLHWNRSSAGASSRLPFGGVGASGNHRPAGILAGAQCVYPMSIYESPPEDSPLPWWPGLSFDSAS